MEHSHTAPSDTIATNFQVFVRVRPLTSNERELRRFNQYENGYDPLDQEYQEYGNTLIINDILKLEDSKTITVINPEKTFYREKSFDFNDIFSPGSTNESVFDRALRPYLEQFFERGYNTTCFAYGITGSGKTHTIFGDMHDVTIDNPGLCFLACDYIFEQMKRSPHKFAVPSIKFSYLEIYNEQIRDLLSDTERNYMIIEDAVKGIVIQDLTEYEVDNLLELKELIMEGHTQSSNFASSSVIQFRKQCRYLITWNSGATVNSKLKIIDLAGSERCNVAVRGTKSNLEGSNINRSLLALGNCINILASDKPKKTFVPYRDSKLTRLLKDSLGGTSKTIMIACISPSLYSIEETVNTLAYACRANRIQSRISRVTRDIDGSESAAYWKALAHNLQSELNHLRFQKRVGDVSASTINSLFQEGSLFGDLFDLDVPNDKFVDLLRGQDKAAVKREYDDLHARVKDRSVNSQLHIEFEQMFADLLNIEEDSKLRRAELKDTMMKRYDQVNSKLELYQLMLLHLKNKEFDQREETYRRNCKFSETLTGTPVSSLRTSSNGFAFQQKPSTNPFGTRFDTTISFDPRINVHLARQNKRQRSSGAVSTSKLSFGECYKELSVDQSTSHKPRYRARSNQNAQRFAGIPPSQPSFRPKSPQHFAIVSRQPSYSSHLGLELPLSQPPSSGKVNIRVIEPNVSARHNTKNAIEHIPLNVVEKLPIQKVPSANGSAGKKKKKSTREPFVAIIDLVPSIPGDGMKEEINVILREQEVPVNKRALQLDNLNMSSMTPTSPAPSSCFRELSDVTRRDVRAVARQSPESSKHAPLREQNNRKGSRSPFKKVVPFQQFWNVLKFHPNKENISHTNLMMKMR